MNKTTNSSQAALYPTYCLTEEEIQTVAHQFHAKLMSFVLGMRARRQGEAAPPVWGELLLLQLGVQATSECHLEI